MDKNYFFLLEKNLFDFLNVRSIFIHSKLMFYVLLFHASII